MDIIKAEPGEKVKKPTLVEQLRAWNARRKRQKLVRDNPEILNTTGQDKLEFNLSRVAANMMTVFSPPSWIGEGGGREGKSPSDSTFFAPESLAQIEDYIENQLYVDAGAKGLDNVKHPWSAATVSYMIDQSISEEDKHRFRGSAAHANYIRDAFQALYNPEIYKFDLFKPRPLNKRGGINKRTGEPRNVLEVGDVVWRPRKKWSDWDYRKLKKLLINTDTGSSDGSHFSSHGDVIVSIGTDANGNKIYHLMGGNVGGRRDKKGKSIEGTQTIKNYSYTEEDILDNYIGVLNRQADVNKKE